MPRARTFETASYNALDLHIFGQKHKYCIISHQALFSIMFSVFSIFRVLFLEFSLLGVLLFVSSNRWKSVLCLSLDNNHPPRVPLAGKLRK